MTDFTFGQIEAVCSDLNRIAPDKRSAFVGRLKQLQKQGLSEGRRPGRGKAGMYSFADVMEFAFAIDLVQAGVMPQRAAGLINRNRYELRRSIGWWSAQVTLGYQEPFYWVVKPQELSALTVGPTSPTADPPDWDQNREWETATIETLTRSEVADAFAKGGIGYGRRTLLIDGSDLVEATIRSVVAHGYATAEDLRVALQEPNLAANPSNQSTQRPATGRKPKEHG